MLIKFCCNFEWFHAIKHCRKKTWLAFTPGSTITTHSRGISKNSFDTGIVLFDSRVKKKVKFFTKFPKTVLWYCCGPTVYDSAHLGHACSYMHFDIIRRIMENYFGLNVIMVMNITDIDDKIIQKSNELNQSYQSVSYLFEKEFLNDMLSLNILPPTIKARVTENIPDIVEFIQELIKSGYAYTTSDGSVYFNINKFSGYGKFTSAQKMDSNGSQVKQSNEDFALWKSTKPGEPFWDSPWGRGRPGWHIECSTIACKYLGHSIDIHSGGTDLKFPHHENEEAQCCARHGISQWINYWIHTGHLFSKGNEKMSKSLKNTVSIRDFLNDYTANILRILCFMIPYRNNIELKKETLEKAVAIDKKISHFLSEAQLIIKGEKRSLFDEDRLFTVLHETEKKVIESFSNDFDTNKALNELLNLLSETNAILNSPRQDCVTNFPYSLVAVYNFIHSTLKKLGYDCAVKEELSYRGIEDLISSTVKFRSEVRMAALDIDKSQGKEVLHHKKYLLKACDSVRENFLKYGIEFKDHGKTTSWNYSSMNVKTSEGT